MTTNIKPEEITAILKKELAAFEIKEDVYEIGTVLSVGDGIARVHGLAGVMAGELVEFPGAIMGMALNLEEHNVGIVIFGDVAGIKEGDIVIFINSRYGGGSRLDYGIVDEIHAKVDHHSHNGKKTVEVTTIVKNARQERGKDIMSKIKNPEHYLLIVTGTDLEDGALEKRLST